MKHLQCPTQQLVRMLLPGEDGGVCQAGPLLLYLQTINRVRTYMPLDRHRQVALAADILLSGKEFSLVVIFSLCVFSGDAALGEPSSQVRAILR